MKIQQIMILKRQLTLYLSKSKTSIEKLIKLFKRDLAFKNTVLTKQKKLIRY